MRIVAFRMDPRLSGRVDAADIAQDAFVEATAHQDVTSARGAVPLFLWLRGVINKKLLEVHRHHLGTRTRNAKCEPPLEAPWRHGDTSAALCVHLTADLTLLSAAAVRAFTLNMLVRNLAFAPRLKSFGDSC